MENHVYCEEEAQDILDAFPQEAMDKLLLIAEIGLKDQSLNGFAFEPFTLPEGWWADVCANCILVRYLDGEQERSKFYVPSINIKFWNVPSVEVTKMVMERLPLGYCSCGKPMPFMQKMLWVGDMIEKKGIRNLPSRISGHILGFFLGIWFLIRPIHQYSVMYNRHPDCL